MSYLLKYRFLCLFLYLLNWLLGEGQLGIWAVGSSSLLKAQQVILIPIPLPSFPINNRIIDSSSYLGETFEMFQLTHPFSYGCQNGGSENSHELSKVSKLVAKLGFDDFFSLYLNLVHFLLLLLLHWYVRTNFVFIKSDRTHLDQLIAIPSLY